MSNPSVIAERTLFTHTHTPWNDASLFFPSMINQSLSLVPHSFFLPQLNMSTNKTTKSRSIAKFKAKLRKSKSASKVTLELAAKEKSMKTRLLFESMSKPSTKDTPKVCDAYSSDNSDIDLISSDNVVFKVHSYRLQSAS